VFSRYIPLVAAGAGFAVTLVLSAPREDQRQQAVASRPRALAPMAAPSGPMPVHAFGTAQPLVQSEIERVATSTAEAPEPAPTEDSLPMVPDPAVPPESQARERDRDLPRSARSR
jgi:hypothetical protein